MQQNISSKQLENSNLYPTNECFDDAVHFCFERMKKDKSLIFSNKMKVVHGILIMESGKPYSHAWVEMDGVVYHTGILQGEKCVMGFDRKEYYREMRVQECTRYTILEAAAMEKKHGYPGPWIEKYRKLCRDYLDEQKRIQQNVLPQQASRVKAEG